MFNNLINYKKTNMDTFKEIYELNFDYVYSFIFPRVAANKETTEDIVQETFINAMKSLNNFKGKSSYKTWLCAIAKNLIFNFYRKSIKSEYISYEENLSDIYDLEDVEINFTNTELRSNILYTLNKLTPVYKYVLILKYMDDYSTKEIAKLLNKTPKAIDGILQRSKISFKKEFIKISGDDYNEK